MYGDTVSWLASTWPLKRSVAGHPIGVPLSSFLTTEPNHVWLAHEVPPFETNNDLLAAQNEATGT